MSSKRDALKAENKELRATVVAFLVNQGCLTCEWPGPCRHGPGWLHTIDCGVDSPIPCPDCADARRLLGEELVMALANKEREAVSSKREES